MEQLANNIKESRNLTPASLKTYVSNIDKIYRELFNKMWFDKLKRLYKTKKVSVYLKTLKDTTSKNVLTSIIVALSTDSGTPEEVLKYYKDLLVKKNTIFMKQYQNHELSQKDRDNWITSKEIRDIKKKLSKKVRYMKVKTATAEQIDQLQHYVVLSLYTDLKPLRNNFCDTLLTKDPDLVSDKNVLCTTSGIFHLKDYKTRKTYGNKDIKLPKKLVNICKKWARYNKTGYLLINTKTLKPVTSNGVTKLLNKVFYPKKISSTLLRKIYLSEKYNPQEQEDDADLMGHSKSVQQLIYTKKQPV